MIDTHHHFWKYSREQYRWISDSMTPLQRDFLPPDLHKLAAPAGVTGVISVQARQTLEETDWLLGMAETPENAGLIRGVVGWVPLISDRVGAELERRIHRKKLVGVRHVLQEEPDEYFLRDDFHRGLDVLPKFGLRYDILLFERQLPLAIQLVDRHPGQIFIVDHLAKPRIRDGIISPWRENMHEIARRPNVFCKISGMVTEADPKNWTIDQLRPYVDTAIDAFGPARLMIGSDWPVCVLGCEFVAWHQAARELISRLSPTEQACILNGTAVKAYGLASS